SHFGNVIITRWPTPLDSVEKLLKVVVDRRRLPLARTLAERSWILFASSWAEREPASVPNRCETDRLALNLPSCFMVRLSIPMSGVENGSECSKLHQDDREERHQKAGYARIRNLVFAVAHTSLVV